MRGGGQCGRPLHASQGLRITGCRARLPFYASDRPHANASHTNPSHIEPSYADQVELQAAVAAVTPKAPLAALLPTDCAPIHGAWGSRVDAVVRLLLQLRVRARALGDAAAAKCVVYSRHEQVLRLLAAACAMNRIPALRYSGGTGAGGAGAHGRSEVSKFVADGAVQALLLSAQHNASGLTLTAASHVTVGGMEPHCTALGMWLLAPDQEPRSATLALSVGLVVAPSSRPLSPSASLVSRSHR